MSKQEELVALEVEGLATQVLVCWDEGDVLRQLTNARASGSLLQLKQPTGEFLVVAPERVIAVHVGAAKGVQLTEVLERLTVARAFSELS